MVNDTIVAISTPPGRSGISVIRSSGPKVSEIVLAVAGTLPVPRQAFYGEFAGRDREIIDAGILLFFQGPRSYTGEDVAEFHTHGGLVVSQLLFETLCDFGARPARPGEFSERAFRNGKIDLAQAEAIADLIDSRSVRAARSAVRTMRGEFSAKANALARRLHFARAQLEATIDFPEDVAAADIVEGQYAEASAIRAQVNLLRISGRQGAKLNHGAAVALVGLPNVGKSTLMNALVGENKAIVSEIPGTTRDVIEADALIQDLPMRFYDTAGLCRADNPIEQEGVDRAIQLIEDADILVLLTDDPSAKTTDGLFEDIDISLPSDRPLLMVHNKIDLHDIDPFVEETDGMTHVFVSAREKKGLVRLGEILAEKLGLEETEETEFAARERHIAALDRAGAELEGIQQQMIMASPEVVAECYRQAEKALGEITGAFSTEALLGEIFARFCIGK